VWRPPSKMPRKSEDSKLFWTCRCWGTRCFDFDEIGEGSLCLQRCWDKPSMPATERLGLQHTALGISWHILAYLCM
jgi:hypothetical protein